MFSVRYRKVQFLVLYSSLFTLMILIEILTNVIPKFADDTKLFAVMKDLVAIESLRSDLERLYEWSNDWIMLFNIDGC